MSSERGPQAALIRFSVRFRGVVVALACVLLGYGIYAVRQAKYDVFPEFAPPQVGIQTEAPGLAPEQVEVLITQPLENIINGVPGLATLRSGSIQGLSVITATFDPSTDIYRDRQLVSERLSEAAAQLPTGAAPPIMTPLTSSASIVLVAGLTSDRRSLMDLHTTAEWTIRPRLLAVPGVAKVAIFSRERKSLQIQIHPEALARFGLGLNDVLNAARQATGVRGGGFIDTPNQRIVLQTEGQSLTPEQIGQTVLSSAAGTSIALANVATVVEGPEPAIGAAAINGQPGVVLNVSEQYGANTVEVTRRVEAALAQLRPGLERAGITLHDDLFRPANFINTATGNVQSSLLLGGTLVVIVLFLFLFDLRSAAISCVAIPLSLLAAIIVLQRFDITLNTMTLGGLAIAIGVVVDDAVVDIENIIRRLRENQRLGAPASRARVVFDACLEVRGAVVYATFAVLFVVLPIITLSGLAGRLFAPLGIAYALAVLASLLVTLTITPALAMMFLTAEHVKPADPLLMRWSKERYRRLLHGMAQHPNWSVGMAVLLTLVGCAMVPFFGGSFIPELKESHFTVHMATVPGTSLTESLRFGKLVNEALHTLPAVRSVAQRVGRAELADDTYGPHYSEFEVDLKPLSGDEAEAVQSDIRRRLAPIPGANFLVYTFLSERIDETLSGYTSPVVVNIFGDDLDVLDHKAREVAKVVGAVAGAADVTLPSPPGLPQLTVRLRKVDLQRWALDPVEALEAIRTAYQGDTVAQTYEGNHVFPVIAILDPASRARVDEVADLPLRTPSGTYVHLRQIADIYERSGRYQVLHQQAQRLQTVTANVVGRDLTSFVKDLQTRIAREVSLPPGTYIELAGEAQAQSQSQRDLSVNSMIAFVAIVLLLSFVTRNGRNLLLVLANLPFAFVGGVLAVFATGGLLSLGSMVGFVALLGITLRNSILLIAHYEHLVGVEAKSWTLDTVIAGSADRLTPILMTSLVTALGVLPLAIGMNEPGREIEGPMAVVLLGGLLTSMVLNLLVLPSLALRYGRFTAMNADDELPGLPTSGAEQSSSAE
ncbi:MAG: CusA/CzcA family heavy metal efflux transporter [Gammaproteobacteria bacterium]|nr:CusA/CzcA family heavy metal efflux transporter [Gammaproteobacteria bacterium]